MIKAIGQYEIRDQLGEGGIGQVHAAFDTILQREVALKSLRPELLSDTNFVERFRAEATSLARLNHPNITTIYSLIPDNKNLYMVMELVRGHTLDDVIKERNGPIPVRESLAIIAQAADGLAYAHSMGVIHRDIKPSNLMIAENGVLKIMDFGIARVRGSQRLTRSGSIVGTLAYMAPEQLRGEEGDETCDLYSLAIVLYEMLSGAPPFSAASEYDLMQAQINERPPRLIPRVPGLDPRVENALLKALAKKPAQRFPSMRAFSDALGASALRMDAPKILHNDTRLLEIPAVPIAVAPVKQSLSQMLMALPADFLPFWQGLSSDIRAAALGAGAALVVGLLVFGWMLFPSSKPAPAVVAAVKPAPAGPATPIAHGPVVPTALTSAAPQIPAGAAPGAVAPSDLLGSLNDILAAANRGDAAAQNALGVKYANGEDGLPRDDVEAVEWYLKSANQGFAKGETNLGDMYLFGRGGLNKDATQALSWYLKAADQDWPDAQFRLGVMYEKGVGTNQDVQRAVKLYRAAASAGYPDAENLLGILLATGSDGVPRDDDEAAVWYRKAADQGFAKAQKNLGDMYLFGRGVDKDYAQAVIWYTKAADQNFADAQFRLGYMTEKGLGVAQSDQAAADLYQKAAHNGSVEAQRAYDRLSPKLSSGGNGGAASSGAKASPTATASPGAPSSPGAKASPAATASPSAPAALGPTTSPAATPSPGATAGPGGGNSKQ
jgi:eukaryotic-like serine/threonine-protein kinase